MRPASIIVTLAAALSTTRAGPAQSPEIASKVDRALTLKRLQGKWTPDLLVTQHGAEAYPLSGRALLFDGARFARIEGKRVVASGTFSIDDGFLRLAVENRSPWDLEIADNGANPRYAFKVEGDVLTLCYSINGKGGADDLTAGEGRQVVVYRRPPADARTPARDR